MEKVTVVIPNFNGMKFLPGCLESLKPDYQTGDISYSILVVDNGSTDGSVEYLKSLDDVKTIFLPENTGFCHAVNIGIKESNTPFVLLLNNDTKAYPLFVQNLYKAIHKKNNCFSVSAKMLMWDDNSLLDDAGDKYNCLGWSRARGKGKNEALYNKKCKIFSSCGGAAIYRKSVFEKIGYFDELHFAYLEDLDIGYRAKLNGYVNLYEPSAKVIHFGSASTGSRYNDKKTLLSASNNIYVVYKNMPVWQIALNILPLILGFTIKFLFFCKKKMGRKYLQGISEGFRKAKSPEGKNMRVDFSKIKFTTIAHIECELWKNLI